MKVPFTTICVLLFVHAVCGSASNETQPLNDTDVQSVPETHSLRGAYYSDDDHGGYCVFSCKGPNEICQDHTCVCLKSYSVTKRSRYCSFDCRAGVPVGDNSNCKNGGVCNIDSPTCNCTEGFAGVSCSDTQSWHHTKEVIIVTCIFVFTIGGCICVCCWCFCLCFGSKSDMEVCNGICKLFDVCGGRRDGRGGYQSF